MSPAPIPRHTPDRAGLIEYLEGRRCVYAGRARNAQQPSKKRQYVILRDRFAAWKRLAEEIPSEECER